jgi:hypothetical protein
MKKLLTALFLCIFLGTDAFGSATIFNSVIGDEIYFNSNVEGVRVFVDGRPIGSITHRTLKYKIKRNGQRKYVMFKKRGYRTEEVFIDTKLAPSFFLNGVFGSSSTSSSSTDSWSTKNSRQYTPQQFYIEMEKEQQ